MLIATLQLQMFPNCSHIFSMYFIAYMHDICSAIEQQRKLKKKTGQCENVESTCVWGD